MDTENIETTIFNNKRSLFVALLYLESEIRRSNLPLTGDQVKKTIKIALEEIKSQTPTHIDDAIIKRSLEKALEYKDHELIKSVESLNWLSNDISNDTTEN